MRARAAVVGVGVVSLASFAAASFARANSTINNIPEQVEMTNMVVSVGADGKQTKAPSQLTQTTLFGKGAAPRAFHLSHDGKRLIAHTFAGILYSNNGAQPVEYKVQIQYKNAFWAPDNHRLMFWTKEGVAVADMDAPGAPGGDLKFSVVFKARPGRTPFGAGWSPAGSHLYVMEHLQEKQGDKVVRSTILNRVGMGGDVVELWRKDPVAYFFMLPLTKFEDGTGAHSDPFRIVCGADDGFWSVAQDGGNPEKWSDVPPNGLYDLVMSPDSKKVLFRLGRSQQSKDGKTKQDGCYIAHLDRGGKGKLAEVEQVYPQNDVHTIWFAPGGKFALWASDSTLAYRAPDAKPETAVTVDIPDRGGKPIHGATWNRDATRIAIACGNRIYVHDVAKKATTLVCDNGPDPKKFTADPVWKSADEIVFTVFKDVGMAKKPGK